MSKLLLIFCKQPVAGMVKSRLAKKIGDEAAVSVYKNIISYILKQNTNNEIDIVLSCFPDTSHPFFQHCRQTYNLELIEQNGNNLGIRMYHALKTHLSNYKKVVLIGTDCPQLEKEYIESAFSLLNENQNIVLGPTFDGGYALIGSNKINKNIFADVNWSTDTVFKKTETNLKQLGWNYSCLPMIRDIDNYDDYLYYLNHSKYKHIFN